MHSSPPGNFIFYKLECMNKFVRQICFNYEDAVNGIVIHGIVIVHCSVNLAHATN